MQRVREFLRDILRQTDLVLLALCCTATAYGILMIYSATRYMNTLRLVSNPFVWQGWLTNRQALELRLGTKQIYTPKEIRRPL